MNRRVLIATAVGTILVLLVTGVVNQMITMPGESYRGELPELTGTQLALRERLRGHVRTLAGEIGERNLGRAPRALERAADYVEDEFRGMGYEPASQVFTVDGREVRNVYVRLNASSSDRPRLVIGAHYDSVQGSPGANDNATGVAATLELARSFRNSGLKGPVDFVAFVNEEPPYFTTEDMGSARYARQLNQDGVDVATMIALETIGYFREEPGSQNYPFPFNFVYPDRGNFIGFVGNLWYRRAVRDGIRAFRNGARFPSQGVAAPGIVPGVGWSDHRSFWQYGYPAFMVTDTALYRYPHYHRPTDTPGQVDFDGLTRVTAGMRNVVDALQSDN